MEDIIVGGSLGHSDHKGVEFKVFGAMRKTFSRLSVLHFKRVNFKLLQELLS